MCKKLQDKRSFFWPRVLHSDFITYHISITVWERVAHPILSVSVCVPLLMVCVSVTSTILIGRILIKLGGNVGT